MTHGSLFSGIGGFDLAAEWAGWENVFHCEYEPFAQQVLKHHFPNSKLYNDVRTFDATAYAGRIDILTGGFPVNHSQQQENEKEQMTIATCGPEMLRIIREVAPKYVVGENVRGLINWSGGMVFEQVCADLEAEGYEVQPYLLPACGKNAPHRRDRIWFVAYTDNARTDNALRNNKNREKKSKKWERESFVKSGASCGNATDSDSNGQQQKRGYDGGSENVKGSKQKSVRSANSKNSVGRSSNGIFEGQAKTDRKISKSKLHKENKSTYSNGVSKLVKESNVSKRTKQTDRNKIDNSRALVQKRQDRVQLSEHTGMVSDNENIHTTKRSKQKNDIPRIKRMEGNVTDTLCERRKGDKFDGSFDKEDRSQKPFEPTTKLYKISNWEDFPTKPPLCGGDDGLPKELDGITFSKWRKESIKAYGNAIVPQVAYEIFKAINKIENELLLR